MLVWMIQSILQSLRTCEPNVSLSPDMIQYAKASEESVHYYTVRKSGGEANPYAAVRRTVTYRTPKKKKEAQCDTVETCAEQHFPLQTVTSIFDFFSNRN